MAAVGGFFASKAATRGPDRNDVETVTSSVAAAVQGRLRTDERVLVAAAQVIGQIPTTAGQSLSGELSRIATGREILAVVQTASSESAFIAEAVSTRGVPTGVGYDLARDFKLVLALARDSGTSQIGVGPGPDGQLTIVEALPLYAGNRTPADVATRRGTLTGYVVLLIPQSLRLGLGSIASQSTIAVRVVADDIVLANAGRDEPGPPPESAVTVPVTGNGANWTVYGWAIEPTSGWPWVILVGGLLLAALVAIVGWERERSIQRAAVETEARTQELGLMARVSPMLQQSLTVGDLLPTFSVEVGGEFALDHMAIRLMSDSGQLLRTFSLGTDVMPYSPDPGGLTIPTQPVPAGEIVTVPLLRAGRVVGTMRARAVRGLTADQVAALVTICNLLAAALGNARLFEHEQEMVSRLREVDRMKTTFVSSVSHELRTSLTAIEGFAGLLDDSATLDDARRTDYVERIRRNARSLGVLIDDLLDFARFERTRLYVSLDELDLSQLVPQVVEQMSSLLTGRQVEVSVEPDVVVLGDMSAIERVLSNLLSNAAKYTPPGSPIDVTLTVDDGTATITVADHGPGISEDQRDRVFELFYRSAEQAASGVRGVGIGLALARQLAQQLGGTIDVRETPGGGASFCFCIPIVDLQLTHSSTAEANRRTE